ncbi:MAG: DUF445 domain-containing protein [Gemmatimonadota bacterium]|nr:DUF445 domain-containing protein [Gemmatimonadota bacterium]
MTTPPAPPVAPTAPAPRPASAPPIRDEATRRAELAAMKRMATGLLGVAFLVLVVARMLEPAHPWLGFVRATAEASLVGGLADWFAVTALFRHPLGIPIPHTAIIQTQKERIGRVLGSFVQNHFLSHDVLAARITSMRLSERVTRWLSDPEESARLARHLAAGVAQAVQALPEAEIRTLIRDTAVSRLQAVPLAPMVGNLLSVVAADDRHQVLLDEALKLMRDSLEQNRDELRRKIHEESPWWVPGAVDHAFQRKLEAATQRLVDEVQANPQHPLRLRFDAKFRDFIDRLRNSPEIAARAETLKGNLLDHPAVEEFASTLWNRARSAAEQFTGDADQPTLAPLARGINAVGSSLAADAGRRAELDEFLTTFLASLLERHRQEVGDLIADTVRQWDPEAAAQRLELAVGRDLQFIRLNGTLVGGLAGLIIYSVSLLFK